MRRVCEHVTSAPLNAIMIVERRRRDEGARHMEGEAAEACRVAAVCVTTSEQVDNKRTTMP